MLTKKNIKIEALWIIRDKTDAESSAGITVRVTLLTCALKDTIVCLLQV